MYFCYPTAGMSFARLPCMMYPKSQEKVYSMGAGTACPEGFSGLYRESCNASCLPKIISAYAMLIAGPDYPSITGLITFADTPDGTVVCADVRGLPPYRPAIGAQSPVGPFGFNIHEGSQCCIGDPEKPFEGCGGHWNPTNQPHGNHAGDFPVLVASNGRARMCFATDRFTVEDVLGRTVIIHENPDDYRTQPSGNSGKRIACGSIRPWGPVRWLS